MNSELHVIAYRNTLLANEDGRYVLGHLLTRLNFFSKCETPADMELRNVAIELLEDLGILFVENSNDKYAEKSIGAFVAAIAGLDVMPLIDAQQKAEEEDKQNDNLI